VKKSDSDVIFLIFHLNKNFNKYILIEIIDLSILIGFVAQTLKS